MTPDKDSSVKRISHAAVALALFTGAPDLSFASSCNRIVIQQIRFTPGAKCWYYAGKATHFEGKFLKGQRTTVEMKGEVWVSPEGQPHASPKPEWTARMPNVKGAHGFYAHSEETLEEAPSGKLEAVLPETGLYTFSFGPCAMTNNYGHVAICTTAPR